MEYFCTHVYNICANSLLNDQLSVLPDHVCNGRLLKLCWNFSCLCWPFLNGIHWAKTEFRGTALPLLVALHYQSVTFERWNKRANWDRRKGIKKSKELPLSAAVIFWLYYNYYPEEGLAVPIMNDPGSLILNSDSFPMHVQYLEKKDSLVFWPSVGCWKQWDSSSTL